MTESHHHVDDIQTDDGQEIYLVRPSDEPRGPAVLYLHWFDEAPNANRTQFLDEAKTLAAAGVVSVLPQLTFPWHGAPTDIDSDVARIEAEVESLRRALSTLTDVDGVDQARVAVVGHDFGAMYGALLMREVEARCAVLIAATPRWSDWFIRFWPITTDRFDYMRRMVEVDPMTAIPEIDCPVLFQFGERDFYIAHMTARELTDAAAEPKQVLTYDTGHAMDLETIRDDRIRFLSEHLGLSV